MRRLPGNNLYVGTSDGYLLWYVIEQRDGVNEVSKLAALAPVRQV